MKQVWILNHYAAEPRGAGGTRHFHLAEQLPKFGWSASIIASGIELNSNRQRLEAHERFRLETIQGVPFLWLKVPPYKGNGGGRMVNMLAYSFRALLPSSLHSLPRPDAIVGSSVHPFAAVSGALLAWRYKVPFIFEVRDLWPQTLVDLGRLSDDGLITKAMRALEGWLYRQAREIVVLLPKAADYICELGIPREKISWVPNGVDLELFPAATAVPRNARFTLMYFGAHGEANGLDNVLRAMAIVQEQRGPDFARLRLIGDGPKKQSLMELAAALNLKNVDFEAPVPKTSIPGLAAEADAFVFNLVDAPVFKYGISSNKLFDFMAASRPIIFCCEAGNNPVADAGAGVTVPPGAPSKLADAIMELAQLPAEARMKCGFAGRSYVESNHDFERIAERFAALLDRACR